VEVGAQERFIACAAISSGVDFDGKLLEELAKQTMFCHSALDFFPCFSYGRRILVHGYSTGALERLRAVHDAGTWKAWCYGVL